MSIPTRIFVFGVLYPFASQSKLNCKSVNDKCQAVCIFKLRMYERDVDLMEICFEKKGFLERAHVPSCFDNRDVPHCVLLPHQKKKGKQASDY